jgi:transposase
MDKNAISTPARNRSKNFSEDEKALIIESYNLGHSPSIIAGILKRSTSQITTFYSRWKLNATLPPGSIIQLETIS